MTRTEAESLLDETIKNGKIGRTEIIDLMLKCSKIVPDKVQDNYFERVTGNDSRNIDYIGKI